MAPRIRFKMLDGTEWVTPDEGPRRGLADEVAFERQFSTSSAVLAIASEKAAVHLAAVAAALEAGEEPPEPDGAVFPRSEWMAFFAWRALRRAHPGMLPARFMTWVDEVEEMEYLPDDDVVPVGGDSDAADADDDVDPLLAEAVASNGSGLDPTAPGPPPGPPLALSSTASATPISN